MRYYTNKKKEENMSKVFISEFYEEGDYEVELLPGSWLIKTGGRTE